MALKGALRVDLDRIAGDLGAHSAMVWKKIIRDLLGARRMTSLMLAYVNVGDLLGRGHDDVEAICRSCNYRWKLPIGFLPPATDLGTISQLVACPACDSAEIELIQAFLQA